MSKVFSFHNKRDGEGWFISEQYSDNHIESMTDPEGGSEIFLPTAIPSPFARFDLTRIAFKNLVRTTDLKESRGAQNKVIASREDERLVSFCFDIGEIFFNREQFGDKLRIIPWDKEIHLDQLKLKAPKYYDAIKICMDFESDIYNFDILNRLYILEYEHKVIGGTSPTTLFIAAGCDLTFSSQSLASKRKLFDSENPAPLYEREREFQLYMYSLFYKSSNNGIFSKRMRDLGNYLEKNKNILRDRNKELFLEISSLSDSNYTDSFAVEDGVSIEIFDVPIRQRKYSIEPSNSDFLIKCSRKVDGKLPLVLQKDYNKPLKYVNDLWDRNTVVPLSDPRTFDQRTLPGQSLVKYPYLTLNDFLESSIIQMVYPINSDYYFDGNLKNHDDLECGYLLPLKQEYFKYFNSCDLFKTTPEGKPIFEMETRVNGAIKVSLRVPIQRNEYITFEKIYMQQDDNSDNEIEKYGTIQQAEVSITTFPTFKAKGIQNRYKVQSIDRNINNRFKNDNLELQFFNDGGTSVKTFAAIQRTPKSASSLEPGTKYYDLQNEYDYIEVNMGRTRGIVVPLWKSIEPGNEESRFAIDFGTTYTHIEYRIGQSQPKAFDINETDCQIATLYHPKKGYDYIKDVGALDLLRMVEAEFVPRYVGAKTEEARFPQRTAIAEKANTNFDTELFSLIDFNIPFYYEKRELKEKITTNLKWAKLDNENKTRIEVYFETLILLIRNKILLNGGALGKSKLVWFYPSSMKPARQETLQNAWNEIFGKHVQSSETVGIVESLAPFYYYKAKTLIQGGAHSPVVSIDIGGGTTDVVAFRKNKPILLTSFRFAANTVLGDGYSSTGAADNNFLTRKSIDHMETKLSNNANLKHLYSVLRQIKEKNKSEDINAFLFSIENDPKTRDRNTYSHNTFLSTQYSYKIIFLYFYAAIIYHVAQLLKTHNIEMPANVVFSGTGSKILKILCPTNKTLTTFTKTIFEKVFQVKYGPESLVLKTDYESPKEITSRGGLMTDAEDLTIDVSKIKTVLNCFNTECQNQVKYCDINDTLQKEIVSGVSTFNDFFIKLNSEISYTDHFGITESSFNYFSRHINNHLRDYLADGMEYHNTLDGNKNDNVVIEESLFFLPIIGSINFYVTNFHE